MSNVIDQFPERLTDKTEEDLAVLIQARLKRWKRCKKKKRLPKRLQEVMNTLVMANMRDALPYARKCCESRLKDDVLVSLCYDALTRSALRFQPNRQRFFVFSKGSIRGRIRRYWASLNPVRNVNAFLSIDQMTPAVERETPGDTEVAPKTTAPTDGLSYTPPDTKSLEDRDQFRAIFKRVKGLLTEHEWDICRLRYDKDYNFPEIGELLHISKSAAHATHAAVLRKIRNALDRNHGKFN